MTFTSSNLEFSPTTTRTISCRIDRYAQLLHDTYLFVTLPDIWSPLTYLGYNILPPTGYDQRSTALGYEFKWIDNIGYNLIDHVEVTANGVVLQRLTGEWLKFYSYLTHDPNKRAIVDQMRMAASDSTLTQSHLSTSPEASRIRRFPSRLSDLVS